MAVSAEFAPPRQRVAGARSEGGKAKPVPLGLLETLAFVSTIGACLLGGIGIVLEMGLGGDDTPFKIFDGFLIGVILVTTTVAHRAFRLQRKGQLASARAAAERAGFRAAQTANIAKSRYLANVSHEIRSPLNAIYGYAQLVERDGVSAKEAARVIRRCAEHLTSLVEGLLDVAQMEHGVLRVRSEDVRLAQFLDGIVAMMRPAAAAKGIEFVYRPPPRLPETVRMDPSRLRQVLINLLTNAIKFTDTGTVTLALDYAGQIARIEIIDTGPGIAPDELERIFDPYDRGDDEGKHVQPGVGLGLSISRAIVEILGGKLEVESTPGEGTCFRVTMMLGEVSGKLEPVVAPAHFAGYEGPRRSILVVDDEADQRALLERLLGGLGFAVSAVPNGETAVALAHSRAFDLAILDISMPGLSGWETAVRLRGVLGQDLRILMLSANVQEFHRPEFDNPVHDFFLAKPIDFGVLTETIGGLLELSWKLEPAPARAVAPVSKAATGGTLGPAAQQHIERLRELLRIGYVRGIEAEIRELSGADGEAEQLAARLFDCLDRFDLASMRRVLEEV